MCFFNNYDGEKIVELYPNGFTNDYEDKIDIGTTYITEEIIYNVFDKAYRSSLRTPTALNNAGCEIWHDPKKFIPSDQAEEKNTENIVHSIINKSSLSTYTT